MLSVLFPDLDKIILSYVCFCDALKEDCYNSYMVKTLKNTGYYTASFEINVRTDYDCVITSKIHMKDGDFNSIAAIICKQNQTQTISGICILKIPKLNSQVGLVLHSSNGPFEIISEWIEINYLCCFDFK